MKKGKYFNTHADDCFCYTSSIRQKNKYNRIKYAFVIVFVLFFAISDCFSQINIKTGTQIGHVWRASQSLDIGYKFGNHTISAVYLYNANSKPSFEYNNVFKRRFFGRDIKERSSLAIEYMYDMKIGKDWFPFLFSSITYSHAPVNRITYTPADYFSTGEAAYRRKESESFPMDAFEFYGGLGLRFILNENFYIYQLAAVGYNYFNKFHMVDTPLIANMGEFGAKFRIGIGYTFGSVTN